MKVFEYHHDKLGVIAEALYGDLGLMTYDAYKKHCIRKGLLKLRNAGPGRKALVDYESLPDNYKEAIRTKYGNPYDTVKYQTFEDFIITDTAAAVYYRDYTYGDRVKQGLPDEKQKEYCTNADLLNTIHLLINNRRARCKALGGRAKYLWENMSEVVNRLDKTKYPHSLPTNHRSLQRVAAKYKAQSYYALIHKGYGNDNSEKINPNAQLWVLSRWADQVRKVAGIQQLFMEYNAAAAEKGWKPLQDPTALHLFLHREDIQEMWWAHRYGELQAKEKFNFQHSTRMPTMRDSLWYSDGTKLNYYYQDAEGKVRTCQVYEVMDAYSEVLLGYCISQSEDYTTQYRAFKMAVQFAGHKPYELGFDNQGGHGKLQTGDFLSKVAHLSIKKQPYNGKSKSIELAFSRFQQQILKQEWFFTGQNIQAKKRESKANLEYINANKANLPTLQQVEETYKQRRDEWNNAPHHATGEPRLQMYQNSHNPQCPKVELWDMVEIFWMLRKDSVKYNAAGLTFTEQKRKHTFVRYRDDGLPDIDFHSKNIDRDMWIKYDPEDLTMIYVYTEDAQGQLRFLTEMRPKIETARGKQEQEQWEAQYFTDIQKLNEQARVQRVDKMEEILEAAGASSQQYGMNRPPLLGVNSSKAKKRKVKKVAEDFGSVMKAESQLVPAAILRDGDEELDVMVRNSQPDEEPSHFKDI